LPDLPTIFALSSGPGRAGVAVVRISGPAACLALDRMAAPRPPPRYAALRRIRQPLTGELLDQGLVLYFAAPASETGEDVVEFQLHGSPAVVRAVLRALASLPGYRLAEPGEFARRAFENGRMDLTAAEGLADLVDAETDAQRRQALAHASGAFGRLCDGWRAEALEARALVEAAIDFSDEADVADDAIDRARTIATRLLAALDRHLADANRGEIVREGFRVVLAGPPNAGKSSLLNALARRDVAIVSPEAGTTRDIIEAHLDLGGYRVVVADTAGLRETAGSIEQEGMRRALARAREADLVIWLVDAAAPVWLPPPGLASRPVLVVLNKADLAGTSGVRPPAPAAAPTHDASTVGLTPSPLSPPLAISALTGAGLPALIGRLAAEVALRLEDVASAVMPTQARHRAALADCRRAIARFLAPAASEPELAAEDLRLAADALGRITGRVDAEEVLGLIFGRFCIGK
jgi:tRNA modification GTPase